MDEDALCVVEVGPMAITLACFSRASPDQPMAIATHAKASLSALVALTEQYLAASPTSLSQVVLCPHEALLADDTALAVWNETLLVLRRAIPLPVQVINQLDALARAIGGLAEHDRLPLQSGGPIEARSHLLVVLNHVLAVSTVRQDHTGQATQRSAAALAHYAPTNLVEIDLLNQLLDTMPEVGYEELCSRRGLANIYHYLKRVGYAQEPAWLSAEFATDHDEAAVIIRAARRSSLCENACEHFARILGALAGDLVLLLGVDSVYLAGDLFESARQWLDREVFVTAYLGYGKRAALLGQVPVTVVLSPYVLLRGAVRLAQHQD